MGLFDVALGIAFAYAFYKGCKNGLFVELASLVAFFIGIFIAFKFSHIAKNILENNVSWSPKTIQVFAFIITLLLVVAAIHFLAKVLSGIASFAFLGWANAILGGILGVLKAIVFIGIVFHLFQKININNMLISKETPENSILISPCMKAAETVLPMLGDWFNDLKEETQQPDTSEDAKYIQDTVD